MNILLSFSFVSLPLPSSLAQFLKEMKLAGLRRYGLFSHPARPQTWRSLLANLMGWRAQSAPWLVTAGGEDRRRRCLGSVPSPVSWETGSFAGLFLLPACFPCVQAGSRRRRAAPASQVGHSPFLFFFSESPGLRFQPQTCVAALEGSSCSGGSCGGFELVRWSGSRSDRGASGDFPLRPLLPSQQGEAAALLQRLLQNPLPWL